MKEGHLSLGIQCQAGWMTFRSSSENRTTLSHMTSVSAGRNGVEVVGSLSNLLLGGFKCIVTVHICKLSTFALMTENGE